jgi:hypothetical protein
VKEKNESTVKYVQALQKKGGLPENFLEPNQQLEVLEQARDFISKQISAEVAVEEAEKSKIEKARNADVLKPAILII